MRTVGSYEAKTHLPRLLSQVEKGETITITKRGQAQVAVQVSFGQGNQGDDRGGTTLRSKTVAEPPDGEWPFYPEAVGVSRALWWASLGARPTLRHGSDERPCIVDSVGCSRASEARQSTS